ncbi:MAG TPA: Gfo/Idh/MocA family oxidoreductase [Humibacter sp.]|jgi:predicted dehydrogenase|nr:Gfo/Idh/MocA family oxidoreductase [Humibacter sp.]
MTVDHRQNERATFAIVGGGFRAEAFLRVAEALPDRFGVTAVVARRPENRRAIRERWSVETVDSIEALGVGGPEFVVVAVSAAASNAIIRSVSDAGYAVLTETPVAPDIASSLALMSAVRHGARIQVAEQYHLEPLIAAQLEVVRRGIVGTVSEASVSIAHDYHGMSLVRRFLGVDFQNARITARRFSERLQDGPGRQGDPVEDRAVDGIRTSAWLEFDGGLHGTYEFHDQQYRSWIRSSSMLVRGSRGELRDETIRHLRDAFTPVTSRLERVEAGGAGSHEGNFLRSYSFDGNVVYDNEFRPARLADDELGIASLLARMADYTRGGAPVYSVAEAAQDHYLQGEIRRAIDSGTTISTTTQEWAES